MSQRAIKDSHREKLLYQSRMFVAGLLVVVLMGGLMARYFTLQILDHEVYKVQSDRNRIQLQPIAPKRGLIYDRHGRLLAENVASYSLSIVRERQRDLDKTLSDLRAMIDISDSDVERFKQRLGRRRPFEAVPLKLNLSEQELAIVAANRHRVPGVEIHAELVRHYSEGKLMAHVLGYVGRINSRELDSIDPINYSDTHTIGKVGIEKYYESELHGIVGDQQVEINARGRVQRVLNRRDPVPGVDLTLNIDTRLQRVATEALKGERAALVAIDPRDGGVLAMVSTPSYDSNQFVGGISSREYKVLRDSPDLPLFNRATQGQYPPGSTVKPVFGLAGLQEGVITTKTRIPDPGFYKLQNEERPYRDWKRGGHGAFVDLHQSIVESCDVFFYELSYRLGIDNLHAFSLPFGLGSRTGIDTPHERPGLMPSREWKQDSRGIHWYPGETLNVGIGQGYMLATPMQLALMTSVLANRGSSFEPRLVHAVNGIPLPPVPRPTVQLDEEHWQHMINSMRDVVHGTKGTARLISRDLQYDIAGKTGTAQVIGIAHDEEYDSEQIKKRNRDHALFVGFAPVDNPRIALAVIVENGEAGSGVAAPVARKVFDAWLLADDSEKSLTDTRDTAAITVEADRELR